MPKRELAIFVIVDIVLVVGVLIAAFHHVKIVYVIFAFMVLSVLNGILLIVTAVRRPGA